MFDKKEYYIKYKKEHKEWNKQWRKSNPNYNKEYCKQWREKNPEYMKIWEKNHIKHRKQYRKNNCEGRKEYNKIWIGNHPGYMEIYFKQYQKEHKEQITERNKIWQDNNPEYYKQWQKGRLKTNIKYSLNRRMGNAIWKSLKRNKAGRNWESLVNYKLKDLIKHLEKTIPEVYTWKDYLDGKLHIDHIIPLSVWEFNNTNQINFQKCWALSNLRLLPKEENLKKSNKLMKPFQLTLRL